MLNPPDVLPEAMRFLLRAILASPGQGLPQSTLVGLVAPEGMAEAMKALGSEEASAEDGEGVRSGGRTIALRSLDALGQVELVSFEGTGDDRLVVPAPAVTEQFSRWEAVSAPEFASFLRRILFAGGVADAPLGQGGGAADLAQALALLHLAPDSLRPFGGYDSGDRTFQQAQADLIGASERWPVGNRERYQSFLRWAVYLGLAGTVPPGRGRSSTMLVADASAALSERIDELVPKRSPIDEVVAAVGESFPVLDGGWIHHQMRSELVDSYPLGHVSSGLALSLRTLHHRKVIRLHLMSDAPVLQFPLGSRTQPFSHVSPAGEED